MLGRIVQCNESLGEERLRTSRVSCTCFPFETVLGTSAFFHVSGCVIQALGQRVGLGEPFQKAALRRDVIASKVCLLTQKLHQQDSSMELHMLFLYVFMFMF